MSSKKFFLVIFFQLLFLFSNAQDIEKELAKQLEALAEDNSVEDYETETEFLYLLKHPLNINKATADEWHVFPFVNDILIKNLDEYRKLFGDLVSVYELQSVPLWNPDLLIKLTPYITVGNAPDLSWSKILSGEHTLRLRETRILEKQKGYSNRSYVGSPDHILFNYRYRYRKVLDAGITCEKDPGEALFHNKTSIDFFSFHFVAGNKGLIKLVALGDFTINLGQGLIHWQSLAFRKGSMVTNIKRQAPVMQPYTSSGEFNFHRGAGIILSKNKTELCIFFSSQKQSATTDSANETFTNISTSGLHRTENEINNRNQVHYFSSGGSFHYKSNTYSLGLNCITHIYDALMLPNGKPYDKYGISGNGFWNASVDYSATPGKCHFFGEAAIDRNQDFAFVNGILLAPDRDLDLVLFARNISPRFQSINGNAFTENSTPSNENGFYTGATFRPSEGWQIDGYFDLFNFPWLKYRVDKPSTGRDYLLMLSCQPSKQWDFYTRFRNKSKELNEPVAVVTHQVSDLSTKSWKIFLRTSVSQVVELKCASEITWINQNYQPAEQGFMTYIETAYKGWKGFSGNTRVTFFDTDGFNSRIYSYESSVPFSSEVPFYDGQGCRFYINGRMGLGKHASLAFRYSRTIFYDKSLIGSGLDEISGKKKSEAKIQFQCAF
jgi:hypothetical protein